MPALRKYFREGKYRHVEAVILFIVMTVIACWLWEGHSGSLLSILQTCFKIGATVIAALGVVAYNLRCKVLDYAIKMISVSCNYQAISIRSKRCSKRLTNIIVLSFFTSVCSLISATIPEKSIYSIYLYTITGFLFIYCLTLYVHVLFCFEELEEIVLDHELRIRKKNEQDRMKEFFEKEHERYPDN